jgi:hypothetical protein
MNRHAIADRYTIGNVGVVANLTITPDPGTGQHVCEGLDPRAIAHLFGLDHGRAVLEE